MDQLPPNGPSHDFLDFPDDLLDQSSFVSHFITILYRKINIPHVLSWRAGDNSRPTTRMAPFLTRIWWDDSGLELFVCHGW